MVTFLSKHNGRTNDPMLTGIYKRAQSGLRKPKPYITLPVTTFPLTDQSPITSPLSPQGEHIQYVIINVMNSPVQRMQDITGLNGGVSKRGKGAKRSKPKIQRL